MSEHRDAIALQGLLALCTGHADALKEALADIKRRAFTPETLASLDKADRRLLDQFAYRYTRLQDDMGARLMPAILRALGEDVGAMPAMDRFNRLEQLGWLPSADEWLELRTVRNQFTHEYPESAEARFEQLQAAIVAAGRLVELFERMTARVRARTMP